VPCCASEVIKSREWSSQLRVLHTVHRSIVHFLFVLSLSTLSRSELRPGVEAYCNAWPYTYSGIPAKQQLELSLRADARSIGSFEVSWSGFLLFTRNYVSHRTRTLKEPIKLKSLPTSSRGPASLAWHASILPSCMLRVAAEVSNEHALPAPCLRPACAPPASRSSTACEECDHDSLDPTRLIDLFKKEKRIRTVGIRRKDTGRFRDELVSTASEEA